jgi:hypothetical protein
MCVLGRGVICAVALGNLALNVWFKYCCFLCYVQIVRLSQKAFHSSPLWFTSLAWLRRSCWFLLLLPSADRGRLMLLLRYVDVALI